MKSLLSGSLSTGSLAVALTALALPGCMIMGRRDRFEYDKAASAMTGEFAPDVYIDLRKQRVWLPPLFRIEIEGAPHNLVMLTFDQTYHRSDQGFQQFVIERMEMQVGDEPPQLLLSPETPLDQRTFVIAKGGAVAREDEAQHVFTGAITQPANFTMKMTGYAVRDNGEQVPFTRTITYRYDRRDSSFHTLFDEWAGV